MKLNTLLGYTFGDIYPSTLKTYVHRKTGNLHINIYDIFVHKLSKLRSNQDVLHLCTMEYFSTIYVEKITKGKDI
jgi:hypothetical protein